MPCRPARKTRSGCDAARSASVLPGLRGRDLVRRNRAAAPDVRVVYISGYTDEEVRERQLMAGADGFLEKPFTREELARVIGRMLHRG